VKVKVGTLRFEQGTFEQGTIITVSEEQFKRFGTAVELVAEPEVTEPPVNAPTPEAPPTEPTHTGGPQPKPRRTPKEL